LFFVVSKYSHTAPARSHGEHLGSVGSHLVFLWKDVKIRSQHFTDAAANH
jgi:hypothetical protein